MTLLQTDSNQDVKLIDPEDKKPLTDKCKDLLDFWKRNSDHPQWKEVINALRNTFGLRNLAISLEESLEATDTNRDHGKSTQYYRSLAGQTAFFPFYIGSGKKRSGDTPLANLFCSSKLFCYSN